MVTNRMVAINIKDLKTWGIKTVVLQIRSHVNTLSLYIGHGQAALRLMDCRSPTAICFRGLRICTRQPVKRKKKLIMIFSKKKAMT
jgi:hypothetical protein